MRLTNLREGQPIETSSQVRRRVLLFYLIALVLFAAGGSRMMMEFWDTFYRQYILGLLAVYFVLLSTERLISPRWPIYQPVYFSVQLLVILAMARAEPLFDYYAVLFPGLCIQAIWFAPQRAALFWVILYLVSIFASEFILFGLEDGIYYTLTYLGAVLFISILGVTTLRAERAQAESQALLSELQTANQKLEAYARQVEELATVQERNRLARELHDSVTQTIFSMTLTAQSTLILIDRDPGRVKEQLIHLKELAQSALAEMRALIQQLRPRTVAEEGLVAALRRHAAERLEKDGLEVEVSVLRAEDRSLQDPAERIPAEMAEGLFRVIQEALNNVVKHAGTSRAHVTLDFRSPMFKVSIEDQGSGFDARQVRKLPGHMGLVGMEERVRGMGGRLVVDSQPGAGTRIRVENLRMEEGEHA